jgi:hypoxanthine phosphoribosyltransferase
MGDDTQSQPVKEYFSWADFRRAVTELGNDVTASGYDPDYIVSIGRGGNMPATMLSHHLDTPYRSILASYYDDKETTDSVDIVDAMVDDVAGDILVVDDIYDTGSTLNRVVEYLEDETDAAQVRTATIHTKPGDPPGDGAERSWIKQPDHFVEATERWVVYPWEQEYNDRRERMEEWERVLEP